MWRNTSHTVSAVPDSCKSVSRGKRTLERRLHDMQCRSGVRAAARVHDADPLMTPVSPAHLAHEVRSVPLTVSSSGQRGSEEGTSSCPGSAAGSADEGIQDVSAPTAGSQCTSQKKPSGQSLLGSLVNMLGVPRDARVQYVR